MNGFDNNGKWKKPYKMTNNEDFERDGYFFCKNLVVDWEGLYVPIPVDQMGNRLSGSMHFNENGTVDYNADEQQVSGSLARYNFPHYKKLHNIIGKAIEPTLGIELHPTYYYERYYFVGQELKRHNDRPACEVSVTLQISTNFKKPWPIWFEKPDGSESAIEMVNGDGCIYKGCERDHWRSPLQSKYNKYERKWREVRKQKDDTYQHQIFLHYVSAQGPYVHHAFDRR